MSHVLRPGGPGGPPAQEPRAGEGPSEGEALDACSRVVTAVAERLTPSVANLRVLRPTRGGRVQTGGGCGVS